ncbi:hypothetical protein F53441_13007 [Fusarium austroafricanum]|uniref:Uncharacterized protein n=1 Tax=Fusarium austroafricanum TaxID=2364996 RepID=A0A8H4JVD9_9HYPO|nr:hypothetical protein F53441_13007 [Fusarium austroafricanum]
MDQSEQVSPSWGSLSVEQYLLTKWDSTSALLIDHQRDQLLRAFIQEDDISAFDSSTLVDITSTETQKLIESVLVTWRSQKLRRIAEKYHPRNALFETLVVLRTYYGHRSDEKFRRVYDAVESFEDANPGGDLFGETDDHWWRILDDASLFNMGSQEWESVYNVLPELATPDFRRNFGDEDVACAIEEVSAVVDSREPEEDNYEDAIAHVAVSGCWLLILDGEAFEEEEMLLVFRDKKGNIVRQSSIKPDEVENIPHYIMRGSITESGYWRGAEVRSCAQCFHG